MKVIVFGSTGGTGRAVITAALAAKHQVTAFARTPAKLPAQNGLSIVQGDAMNPDDVAPTLVGQDAVILSLGNSQNAFAMKFGVRRTTPRDICAAGTANILQSLPATIPLIVVGAFGTGDTRPQLPLMFKIFYRLILKEQMADKEYQDVILKSSSALYTLIQPVALTDKPATGTWTATLDGTYGKPEVARTDLAAYIIARLAEGNPTRKTITFSGQLSHPGR
jgi:uncharacterized protein YbjT (DUF2867 family)